MDHSHPLLSLRARRLAESPTLGLLARVQGLQAQGRRVIGFHIGEPDFGIPPNVAEAMVRAIGEGRTTYTHQAGIPELRQALCDYYQARYGLHLHPDRVVVTAGPKDTIFKCLGTFVDPGDRVVVFDPHWEAYGEQVCFYGGEPIYVARNANDLSYTLDAIESAFRQHPKAAIFTNPDNPTGYVARPRELQAIADLAREHRVVLLSDEIYWLLCHDAPHESMANYYPEGTVILSGASKAWAGTGLRVGFALFPEALAAVAESVARVTGQASSSVNTPAQYGVLDALTNPETRAWEHRMAAEFRDRRDLVQETIGHLLGYDLGGAFYASPRVPCGGDAFAERLLEEEGVCVLPLSSLSSGPHHAFDDRVRIAYVTDRTTLEEGLLRVGALAERMVA